MAAVTHDLREITAEIVQWCDGVFPDRTVELVAEKLAEEMQELKDQPFDAWEMADVLIILLDLCDMLGFDPAKLIKHKMSVNKKRSWLINEQGLLKHDSTTRSVESGNNQALAHGEHKPHPDTSGAPA
jgi:predicted house-cleaning noncanonical NTP pyrophosphatase (MazG superfamily)